MVCYLCNKEKQSLGFQIRDAYVCNACEEKIVASDVLDLEYDFLIERFKFIWYSLLAGEEHA